MKTIKPPLPNTSDFSISAFQHFRNPFFASATRQVLLHSLALSWVGTPFAPHAAIRGAGVDCVHLCGALYIGAGALEKFDPPKYTCDGAPHRETSQVTEWVQQSGRFQEVLLPGFWNRTEQLIIGDLVCFQIGKVEHHCGVCITLHSFVHALRGHGVIESSLYDPTYSRRLTAAWRPMEAPHS
jgi:cell wall-associated NlpC family hydrolase